MKSMENLLNFADGIKHIFKFFPPYLFNSCFDDIRLNYNDYDGKYTELESAFLWNNNGKNIFYFFINIFIYFAIILFKEYLDRKRNCCMKSSS